MNIEIRPYQPSDEQSWLRCRVLAFLNTAYFDNVLKEKETYEHPSIELVAIEDHQVVGLIDVEYEVAEKTVCSRGEGLGGMIWHIAVHPDYRRKGIGNQLLVEAEKLAKETGLNRFEAWTRDDVWVSEWYVRNGFQNVDSYYHVYIDNNDQVSVKAKGLHFIQGFAHYTGDNLEQMKSRYERVHECRCYEKTFS
ncbi:GNAT family N-acetyltransferase [Alkalicoccobacillus gibsonii]|uniref:GNAT family N-acetyltransferase n=1 Tax=Alkalicoccobacillus gibsonii TaxID=79881 RepID=UPI00193198D5|nr:N-acetyltransferase [Alkalicoccobacillus gibsonii]MBM0067465.1 GNAT family N-acetyltransferase [Alkalicoccobacillus gibsonii]